MELHLEADQSDLLLELLNSNWRDLRYEIANTDNLGYKHMLREREALLHSILAAVGHALAEPAPADARP